MTKENILKKHFKTEFGHEGHGEFMQYILAAMEEYAQQQVKNCSIPDVGKRFSQSDLDQAKTLAYNKGRTEGYWEGH